MHDIDQTFVFDWMSSHTAQNYFTKEKENLH